MDTPQDETFKRFLMEMVSYMQRSFLNQATVPVEVVPEALANSISEFSFDPENGLTFDRWYSKYEDSFLRDGENLEDAVKVRLLLSSVSLFTININISFYRSTHESFHSKIQLKNWKRCLAQDHHCSANVISASKHQCVLRKISFLMGQEWTNYAKISKWIA